MARATLVLTAAEVAWGAVHAPAATAMAAADISRTVLRRIPAALGQATVSFLVAIVDTVTPGSAGVEGTDRAAGAGAAGIQEVEEGKEAGAGARSCIQMLRPPTLERTMTLTAISRSRGWEVLAKTATPLRC